MHTPSLGHFGWKLKKVIKGKEYAADIPDGKPSQRHQCDACKACFDTTQALGGHRHNCKVAKAASTAEERVELGKIRLLTNLQSSQQTNTNKR